jgi:hypothetical protein
LSTYDEKHRAHAKMPFRFRWKYAVAAFFVYGVLSLTIGQEDPLVTEAKAVRAKYERLFKINKDEKTASGKELDGPEEKTFQLDTPHFAAFVKELAVFGKKISEQSVERARAHDITSPQIQAVAEAAVIYHGMEFGIYKNYMRLAHRPDLPIYERPNEWKSYGNGLIMGLGVATGASGLVATGAKWEYERWEKLNRDKMKVAGTRGFSPDFFEFLNLRLDPLVGQVFYGNRQLNKQFNIRHTRDENGDPKVELFLNSFEKQLAEYQAIQEPKNKGEYLKLLQFSAIRESLANRWAMRRLTGDLVTSATSSNGRLPIGFGDSKFDRCAPDLVSFRADASSTVNDLDAYSTLWQEDRHNDLATLGALPAANATKGKNLLLGNDYAELYLNYVAQFDGFKTIVLPKFGADVEAIKRHFLADKTYASFDGKAELSLAEKVAENEEYFWSGDRAETPNPAMPLSKAFESFHLANFPADDLSIPAVVKRYVDDAYEGRALSLAQSIVLLAKLESVPAADVALPSGAAPQVEEVSMYDWEEGDTAGTKGAKAVAETSAQVLLYPQAGSAAETTRAVQLVKSFLAPKEKAWKQEVAKAVERALLEKLGMNLVSATGAPIGLGYLRGQDAKRYEAFQADVMKNAAGGARGIQSQDAAKKAERTIAGMFGNKTLYPSGAGGAGAPVATYPEPKTLKDPSAPEHYAGIAPFRVPAEKAGIPNVILLESADQLSQFFQKKIGAVLEFDASTTNYVEPKVTAEIAQNAVVMRGIEQMFGFIAQAAEEKSDGGYTQDDCEEAISNVGKTVPSGRKRKPANDEAEIDCADPTRAKAVAKRRALEAAIVPGAKKAYSEFLKGLTTPATYKYPERAKQALAEAAKKKAEQERIRSQETFKPSKAVHAAAVRDDGRRSGNSAPSVLASERAKFEADLRKRKARDAMEAARREDEIKRKNGFFRTGRDRSLDKTGGEFYLEKKEDRETAKRLYIEALAMLGISQAVVGAEAKANFRVSERYLPNRVTSWVTTEYLIRRWLPSASLLERMTATVSDQLALGRVLEQEAIARAPILTLQASSKWNDTEKDEPILLRRVSSFWSLSGGWNAKAFKTEFRRTLASAVKNDVGKAETFCKADVRNYHSDRNFRLMFTAVSGIRNALATDPRTRKWDEEISQEVKTPEQKFVEYFDHYGLWMLGAMILLQVVLAVFTGGSSLIFASVATRAGMSLFGSFVAKFSALFLFSGNLSLLNIVFSLQSVAMYHFYHYKMPPQLGFTFQVANSQILGMESAGFGGNVATKLANGSVADREKLNALRSEMRMMQIMSYGVVAAEFGQAYFFTFKGLQRTFGKTGRMKLARLSQGSQAELAAVAGHAPLKELVRKKGLRAGVAEYWAATKPALRHLRRVTVVGGGQGSATRLQKFLGTKLSQSFMKEKKPLREFFAGTKERLEREAQELIRVRNDYLSKQTSKQLDSVAPGDFSKFGKSAETTIADLRKQIDIAAQEGRATLVVEEGLADNASKLANGAGVHAWLNGVRKGKIEKLQKEAARFGEMMKQLDEMPVSEIAGEAETARFFRSLGPDDFGMLRKRIQYSEGLLPRSLRRSVIKDFKAYDYLMDDWKIADEFTRATQKMLIRGLPDILVAADGTVWKAEEFKRQPDGTWVATRVEKDEQGRPISSSRMEHKIDAEDFYVHPERYLETSILLYKKSDEGTAWKASENRAAAPK